MERIVYLFGDEFTCRNFTSVDPDYSGIEVSRDGDYLGQIVDVRVPDVDDEDEDEDSLAEIKSFEEEVEEWVIENGY